MERVQVHIRWMIRRDYPDVLAIEDACFEHLGWNEGDFLFHLRHRNVIGMVAEKADRIVGYMIYEMLSRRTLGLLNFAVAPDCQRCQVGAQMVQSLLNKLGPGQHQRKCILAFVRETNLAAQLFFKSQGFECKYVDTNYYDDEAAYAMAYDFKEESNAQPYQEARRVGDDRPENEGDCHVGQR